jgi:hypothetical protein
MDYGSETTITNYVYFPTIDVSMPHKYDCKSRVSSVTVSCILKSQNA